MFATPERACSGYLVESGGTRVWMDAGGGTWQALQTFMDFSDLDAIVLSHRHPDHTIDVLQCFHARRYGCPTPLARIPLWAPDETIERLRGFSPELDESFEIEAIQPGDTIKVDNVAMSFFQMVHSADTVGMRVDVDGSILSYSADTGPTGDFEGLATGAHTLLCEATFQDSDEEWEGHMSAAQAGRVAARLGVERLVLTHLPSERDLDLSLSEASSQMDGTKVTLAYDGMRIEL
jgi:ribonuclease BN (tRNA processing enzyme)